MRAGVSDLSLAARGSARIVENRRSGLDRIHGLADLVRILEEDLVAEAHNGIIVVHIHALRSHSGNALVAEAGLRTDDIKKNAVGIVTLTYLLDLSDQGVEILRIKAKGVVSGSEKAHALAGRTVALLNNVLGMLNSILFVKARRNVYGCLNAYLVGGIYLRAQKIEIKIRVHLVNVRGMVGPAVMAL